MLAQPLAEIERELQDVAKGVARRAARLSIASRSPRDAGAHDFQGGVVRGDRCYVRVPRITGHLNAGFGAEDTAESKSILGGVTGSVSFMRLWRRPTAHLFASTGSALGHMI
jgi:hypothetical protein